MNQRSTYWLAVAGLLVAMLALGLGVVVVVRANDSSAASSSDGMGNHGPRRTFASLVYEAGAIPPS